MTVRFRSIAVAAFAALTCLATTSAKAGSSLAITTSGVVTRGSDPGNLLGVGGVLDGDSYALTIYDPNLGANYLSNGAVASDNGDALLGAVTLTIQGHTVTTVVANSVIGVLEQSLSSVIDQQGGFDASNAFVLVGQTVTASTDFAAIADLQTSTSYTLTGGDFGSDTYSLTNAADTLTASFNGTPTSLSVQVSEPATPAILAVGLLGLGIAARRRAPVARAIGAG